MNDVFSIKKEPTMVSVKSITELKRSSGWMITCCVFVFIYSVILLAGGVINMSNMHTLSGLVSIGLGTLYLLAAVNMIRFCKSISRLNADHKTYDLERAMEIQSRIWRYLGISSIIFMVIMAFTFFLLIH